MDLAILFESERESLSLHGRSWDDFAFLRPTTTVAALPVNAPTTPARIAGSILMSRRARIAMLARAAVIEPRIPARNVVVVLDLVSVGFMAVLSLGRRFSH